MLFFRRRRPIAARALAAIALLAASAVHAQVRVGKDSATRLTRFGRDLVYVTVTGFGWAAWDQTQNDPPEWGEGWHGYRHRVISNVGKSFIQESVTQGLAAAMKRPLDYTKCECRNAGAKFGHAVLGAVTDQLSDGSHPIAIPRIIGAYGGAYAQASWRPGRDSHAVTALLNGSATLGIGALINLYYEFKPW